MSKAYHEIMDPVVVTEEMKKRVLNEVFNASGQPVSSEKNDAPDARQKQDKVISPSRWKRYRRYASLAACLALLVIGVSVFPKILGSGSSSSSAVDSEMSAGDGLSEQQDFASGSSADGQSKTEDGDLMVGQNDAILENSVLECTSLDELSEQFGYTVPELTELPFEIQQTEYYLYGDSLAEICYYGSSNSIYWRISVGQEDNSDDETEYTDVLTQTVNGHDVTLKGDGGSYNLAVWQDDAFSYSILLDQGIQKSELLTIIQSVSE